MRATTDNDTTIKYDVENKPGISNLLSIYSVLKGVSIEELEKEYEGKGYGDFKKDLVLVTIEALKPIKERFNEIRYSKELPLILEDGANRARKIAESTMKRVKNSFGLGIK